MYISILHVCACDAARFGPVLVTNHTEGCVDVDLCMNTSICIYMYIITRKYQLFNSELRTHRFLFSNSHS